MFGNNFNENDPIKLISLQNWETLQNIEINEAFFYKMKIRIKMPKSEIAQFGDYIETLDYESDQRHSHLFHNFNITFYNFEQMYRHRLFTSKYMSLRN